MIQKKRKSFRAIFSQKKIKNKNKSRRTLKIQEQLGKEKSGWELEVKHNFPMLKNDVFYKPHHGQEAGKAGTETEVHPTAEFTA